MTETAQHQRNLCRIFGWSQFTPGLRDDQHRVNVFAIEHQPDEVARTLQVYCFTVDLKASDIIADAYKRLGKQE